MKVTAFKPCAFKAFLRDESGAVTVDWVVLAAAVVLLSVPMMATFATSTESAADGVADRVVATTED